MYNDTTSTTYAARAMMHNATIENNASSQSDTSMIILLRANVFFFNAQPYTKYEELKLFTA